MPDSHQKGRLLLIDDDLMSRQVLALLAEDAGFTVEAFESGESALSRLAEDPDPVAPLTILTDMQMPGLCGDPLARLLRASAGPHLRLFAMSGSNPTPDATRNYDAFLLKPFSIDDLETLLNQLPHPAAQPALTGDDDAILNRATFNGLAHSMPKPQLHALYKLCLDDAEKRIASMRLSRTAHDNDAYIRAAHAIKGGCGMVGASELAALAAHMEENGLPNVDNIDPLEDFMAASARLRRILDARLD